MSSRISGFTDALRPQKSQPIVDLHPRYKLVGESGRFRDHKSLHDLAIARPAHKPGNIRLRHSASPASEDEEFTEVEDATPAALSRLRFSSRRKPPGARYQRSAGSSVAPIVVDTPGKPSAAAAPSLISSGGVSSDSEGAISVTDSPRVSVTKLLTLSDYGGLPLVKSDRAEWIPEKRDRVTRSTIHVAPWSARRISRISVAELNVDFLFRHFFKPNGIRFRR